MSIFDFQQRIGENLHFPHNFDNAVGSPKGYGNDITIGSCIINDNGNQRFRKHIYESLVPIISKIPYIDFHGEQNLK